MPKSKKTPEEVSQLKNTSEAVNKRAARVAAREAAANEILNSGLYQRPVVNSLHLLPMDMLKEIGSWLSSKELLIFSLACSVDATRQTTSHPFDPEKQTKTPHRLTDGRYNPTFVKALNQLTREKAEQQLLPSIVHGDIPKAIGILKQFPDLLFKEGRVTSPSRDKRKIRNNAYRVLLGEGDVWASEQIHKEILPRIEHGEAIANEQFHQQFPYFNEPLAEGEDEEARLYDDRNREQVKNIIDYVNNQVVPAIAADPCTHGIETLPATTMVLEGLRQRLMPDPKEGEEEKEVTTGLHFPLAIMKAIQITYDRHNWTYEQCCLYSRVVMGLTESVSTEVDNQCFKQGLNTIIYSEAMKKGPDRRDGVSCAQPKGIPAHILLRPLGDQLGQTGFIDLYWGDSCFQTSTLGFYNRYNKYGGLERGRPGVAGGGGAEGGVAGARGPLHNFYRAKAETIRELCSQSQRSQDTPITIVIN